MVIFYDSFPWRKYYVLVLPVEIKIDDSRGNLGLLKHYRKKGVRDENTLITANWEPPSKIDDALPPAEFDKWYKYILSKTTNEDKKKTIKFLFSGKVVQ